MEPISTLAIAKEAGKQVSPAVDAVLEPFMKRLREWAYRQDVQSRAASDLVTAAFDNYLRRLLKRVSCVTTIVFPQQALPLPTVFEPLSLEEGGGTRRGKRGAAATELTTVAVLVDGAGMGKSTFAKARILDEIVNGRRIPLFLELRHVTGTDSIVEALAAELGDLATALQRSLVLSSVLQASVVTTCTAY
jgi:hypothetical protein